MALGVQQFHNMRYNASQNQRVDGWTHRDIKISNFLVFEVQDPNTYKRTVIKLCDFGISIDKITNITEQGVGTLSYMSPEHFGNTPMTQKIDIWALAVAYTQLLTNDTLFFVSNQLPITEQFIAYGQLIQNFKEENLPFKYNPQIRELLLLMFSRDPTKRPTTKQIIQTLCGVQINLLNSSLNNKFVLYFTINNQEFEIFHMTIIHEQLHKFSNNKYGVEFLVLAINEDITDQPERPENFIYITYCRHPKIIGIKFMIGYDKNLIENPFHILYEYSFQNILEMIKLIIRDFDDSTPSYILNSNQDLKKYVTKYFQKDLADKILHYEVKPSQNFILTLFYVSLIKQKESQNFIQELGKINLKNIRIKEQIQLLKSIFRQTSSDQVEKNQISELSLFIQKYFNIKERVIFIHKIYSLIKETQAKFLYIYLYLQQPYNKTIKDVDMKRQYKLVDYLVISIKEPEFRRLAKNTKIIPKYTEFLQFSYFTNRNQICVYQGLSQIINDAFSDQHLFHNNQSKIIFSMLGSLQNALLKRDNEEIEVIFSSLLMNHDQLLAYQVLSDLFSSIYLT